jgi:DNA-damage-inducible protein J
MSGTKTNLNIRVDAGVKQRAAELFSNLGLDMTTAVEMFLRQSLTENGIPFKPAAGKSLDQKLKEAIDKQKVPVIELPIDENGNIYVDKEKYPDIYEWAVGG